MEHNVLVISKYYSRITTKRLATLLCLKEEEVRVLCQHAGTLGWHIDFGSQFVALAPFDTACCSFAGAHCGTARDHHNRSL